MARKDPQTLTEVYAVLGQDSDGNEGVASYLNPQSQVMTPLIGGLKRAGELLVIGKALAQNGNVELRFVKFSGRVDLETISPSEETP